MPELDKIPMNKATLAKVSLADIIISAIFCFWALLSVIVIYTSHKGGAHNASLFFIVLFACLHASLFTVLFIFLNSGGYIDYVWSCCICCDCIDISCSCKN